MQDTDHARSPERPPESQGRGESPGGASLAAALERLAAGDMSARERIIELVADRLRRLARRLLARFPRVSRWDDTDDVFQNALLRLHRALARQGGPPRSVMALAAAELKRELLDLARKYAGPWSHASHHATNTIRGPDGCVVGAHDREAPGPEFDREAPGPESDLDRWTRFHEVIAALPPSQREVFDLVWYVGADQSAIAALLGCSPRTVRVRWREARDAVRSAMGGGMPR